MVRVGSSPDRGEVRSYRGGGGGGHGRDRGRVKIVRWWGFGDGSDPEERTVGVGSFGLGWVGCICVGTAGMDCSETVPGRKLLYMCGGFSVHSLPGWKPIWGISNNQAP